MEDKSTRNGSIDHAIVFGLVGIVPLTVLDSVWWIQTLFPSFVYSSSNAFGFFIHAALVFIAVILALVFGGKAVAKAANSKHPKVARALGWISLFLPLVLTGLTLLAWWLDTL